MILSPKGEAFIKGFEELRLEAYPDERGIPTIGWGHTGPEIHLGLIWTEEQAEAAFVMDTQRTVSGVNAVVSVPLTQNQFDALVSFGFNVGVNAEAHSTLIQWVNANDFTDAATQFIRWNHTGGVVSAGLTRRRLAEHDLFISPA